MLLVKFKGDGPKGATWTVLKVQLKVQDYVPLLSEKTVHF